MRRILIIVACCVPAWAGAAAPSPEGRWEGAVAIPGRPLHLVVDLKQDAVGAWTGSFIVPGLGIKGAPLTHIVVKDAGVTFDSGKLLETPGFGPARFNGHLDTGDRMEGEMSQGGNVAGFALRKVAAAQVELPPRSTAVRRELEDQWTGEFELGGYPRHVTITFANHTSAGATATFVIVGKQTTNLPVDLVTADAGFVRIESQANHVVFEGHFDKDRGEIRGIVELGPMEVPLTLRRAAGRPS